MHKNGISSGALDEQDSHAVGVLESEAAGDVGDEPGFPLAVVAPCDGGIGGGTTGFAPTLSTLAEVVPCFGLKISVVMRLASLLCNFCGFILARVCDENSAGSRPNESTVILRNAAIRPALDSCL